MEKIVTYRAFDGEEFDTKTECEEYENSLNITSNKDIVMLDRNFRKVTGDSDLALNLVSYLFFKTMDSILGYNECARYFGYTTVCADYFGVWLEYDETLDAWGNVDSKIEKLRHLMDSLRKAKEDIDGNN